GLAGLAVADDELPLAAPDRDHRVDRLDAGLQGLMHRLPLGDAGGDDVQLARLGRLDRARIVQGLAPRVDDAPEHRLADRHLEQAPGGLDDVAFLDGQVVAVNDGADGVLLEVEHLAHHDATAFGGGLELEEFAGHRLRQAVDAGDAIADLDHAADL